MNIEIIVAPIEMATLIPFERSEKEQCVSHGFVVVGQHFDTRQSIIVPDHALAIIKK